jgi:predicted NBD/HSP70 family sugar kinase
MTSEPESTPNAIQSIRETNRWRIAEALRAHGRGSRADLQRWTGLSRSTVAAVVADLQSRGAVLERLDDGDRTPGRGRPAGQLQLNPAIGAVIGVAFDHEDVRVAIADLFLNVLAERQAPVDFDAHPSETLDLAAELIAQALADAGTRRPRVIAAGVSVPSPINRGTAPTSSPVLLPRWLGRDPGRELSNRIGIDVRVDNDANLGALAELFFGAARGLENIIYIKIASGIGAGLVLGGKLYRGQTGIAGEIGHVHVKADGPLCRCGKRGCLETVASTTAVLEVLDAMYGPDLTLAGVMELLAADNIGAQRAITDAGRAVGRVLASLCSVLNPATIVVGGELSQAAQPLLSGIRESIDRYAEPYTAHAVELIAGELGARAEVLGALALANDDSDRARSELFAARRHV